MSDDSAHSRESLAALGSLSSGVAGELARPLRDLREVLAEMVERIDHFHNQSRGPSPYPWQKTRLLREELAHAYLVCRRVTRLADDLANAVSLRGTAAEAVDINKLVESAVNLARHRISATTEVFIDLGTVPLVRVLPSELVLSVAHILSLAAASAGQLEGAAISLKTRREQEIDAGVDEVVIYLADNGAGCPDQVEETQRVVGSRLRRIGGTFEGASEAGSGSVFELRMPVGR
jgi:C4-dicarboxylate-specific signal transduction histidine kinase